MRRIHWIAQLLNRQLLHAGVRRIAGGVGIALLAMTAGTAVAQDATPAPDAQQPTAPTGYTLHESIDLGGHMVGLSGSGAMYDTMVNMQSGPRVLGETFELRALPGTKHMLVDNLSAFSNGWGGDPNNFARMDFYKGNLYEFSGTFRRDRQYFDYDLLGNPNVPGGLTMPVGPTGAQTGTYVWPQITQSPFLFNTVRRMTDTDLTLLPLSKVTFRAGYSQDTFQGPSLTPSGYQYAGSSSVLLEEMQRNGTDRFLGGIDWKPVRNTKLTFEEQIDHYKADSSFTLDPSSYIFQEADGTKVAPLVAYYNTTAPTSASLCNTNSTGTAPFLSAPSTPGGLLVINPACAVTTSYTRSQPTRILYPTEIFRFQSSSVRNLAMNGDVRYTSANMNLANYNENFQGLTKTTRELIYTGYASAKRTVTAIDYGVDWQASRAISVADQFTFSNAQQPGASILSSLTTVATAATANSETINNPTLITTVVNAPTTPATAPIEGSSSIGVPQPGFFGQKFITNDATVSWDGLSRTTISLTYRYRRQEIAEGIPHNAPLTAGDTTSGTVTINQDGGILNVAVRPTEQLNVDASIEVLYADNVFTAVAPREQQHYRLHALYKPKSWATVSGAYNDMELHNNTNNAQSDVAAGATLYYGPLNHVAYSRIGSVSADLNPNEHYGLDLSYAYSDVYTATNICYTSGAAGGAYPGTATAPGTSLPPNVDANGVCAGVFGHGGATLVDWYGKDFEDAPTQSGSAAILLSPSAKVHSSIGYRINSVNGTRFYQDARDVAGSLVSTYQSPFVNVEWKLRPGFVWKAEYNFFGYGEGGSSGAPYCSTSTTATATVVPCNSSSITGPTGLTESPAGLTAPRNFHANNVTLGLHYEF
ncbi:MAG TPA: hypothetical protein VHX37_15405 [Acidobacteriaceae bacterium]|jgi:hypothetical protein|nr:hypothetical protein [Acidobacteriaceae bacterium]